MSADRKALETAANAIRFLSADAVQKANSGHPGMPMGMAEIAVALWRTNGGAVRHNPAHPGWVNRDRVVISNGHGSMLIYSILHLTGYGLSTDDLAGFRQFHSRTPGHPEVDITPGIETTTGPLGQGFANAVGLALAEKVLGETFNRPGHDIVDHQTWVLVGDGCLMEGISHEAASLAGLLKLGKLTAIYDDNGISIDGHVEGWFTEDTPARFRAYGWHVVENVDGHDIEAVAKALAEAKAVTGKPSLICAKTVIGKGSPNKEGTHTVHGAPLGDDEIKAMRATLGWTCAPFEVPDAARLVFDATKSGADAEAAWQKAFDAYKAAYPDLAAEYIRRMRGDLPEGFDTLADKTLDLLEKAGTMASRKASQIALEQFALGIPEMVGGSADLTGSNLTDWKDAPRINDGPAGRYLSGGVREFGLAAMFNGMALHGGFIPFTGTFLMFSDYERSAIRMAALMNRRVIHVLTHDSIGLGEDGPTHQPVEHAASLRLIPNLAVWRPCDGFETAVAWAEALRKANGPSALLLSRQNLPAQARDQSQKANVTKGGYVLADRTDAKAVILATGSEVALAMDAQARLDAEGVGVRVVSVPNLELFMAQSKEYRAAVLPKGLPRLAVEAGHPDCWWKLVGLDGDVIGMTTFGESAPASVLFKHFGFTPEAVAARIKALI